MKTSEFRKWMAYFYIKSRSWPADSKVDIDIRVTTWKREWTSVFLLIVLCIGMSLLSSCLHRQEYREQAEAYERYTEAVQENTAMIRVLREQSRCYSNSENRGNE